MSRKYKFKDKSDLYFVTFGVIEWIDVFTRNIYKDIMLDSWKHCMNKKGLKIYAWVIMTNHVHMIISSEKDELPNIMRDMKSFTSTHIKKAIIANKKESRKKWMMSMMVKAGTKNSNNNEFQLWQQHSHPLILDTNRSIDNTIDYIHNNPVIAGFVENPEDYLYSSARDYAGRKGLIDIEVLD